MRVDIVDGKRGVMKVRIDSEDDLWLLSLLLSPGDKVKGLTTRDVSLGYEKRRIPMTLTIEVRKVEFQPFTNRLRVHGIVVEGPDRFGVKGSHHTLNIDVGSEVTVYKKQWNPRILDELVRFAKPYKVLLVAVDMDEYAIAVLRGQGIKIVDERSVSIPFREDAYEQAKRSLIASLAKRIAEVCRREGIDIVIVASPGSLKDEIAQKVKEVAQELRVYTDTVANGGYAGIQEILRRDTISRILRDNAVVEASKIIEEFDKLIVKQPNRVAYGIDYVHAAARIGAIDTLVITDEALFASSENSEVKKTIDEAVNKNARIVIVPVDSPVGQRIKYLGGMIAILRYPVDLEPIVGESKEETSK
ncbi:MAG: mRNA surveillance protein pelota [Crenarchaeota archaeon]|nr:mRNA surveillance protein pelota [Thermoproteota archaeon]